MSDNHLPDFDVAIVGGGASGVYTAWRMLLEGAEHSEELRKWKEERGTLRIAIFEGSKRVGGRLLSAKAPGLPDVVCEIGGMRYVSSQTLVKSLVENKFNLPRKELNVTEPDNLMLLRGKYLKIKDLNSPDKLPFNLANDEIEWLQKDGNTADNFLGFAVQKIFPKINSLHGDDLRKFLNEQIIDGIPLYKHGFWNLVASKLSHEAYQIAITTVGYDCLGYNINAVDAICEYFDFTPGVKYYLLANGYDTLIWTMQQQFQAAGGELFTDAWLEGFDTTQLHDGCEGVKLHFKGEKKSVTARTIMLAMPKRSLELLAQTGPVLNPEKAPHVRSLMNAVVPINLYKMFIAYSNPWWQSRGVSTGRSVTDIPIRQCYYWGGEKFTDPDEPANTNAIMMVYNDAISSEFWGGLRTISLGAGDTKTINENLKFRRKAMPFSVEESEVNEFDKRLIENWKLCEAPKAMVHEMHRELMILHNVTDAPEPLEAAFVDWGDDPFGGAVHFWNPGYQSTKVMEKMIQPVQDFPCYVCGEAYSNNQTWVEGAFQTAELVLRKFSIPEPDWIQKND